MSRKRHERRRRQLVPGAITPLSATSLAETPPQVAQPDIPEIPEIPESPDILEPVPTAQPSAIPWVAILYVAGLIAFAAWYMGSAVFRSWFFSSDEYVVVAEVIRFVQLDFHQHFFDMPGTPLMFFSATIWWLLYSWEHVFGQISKAIGMETFTFQHLAMLFELTRAVTLGCALISIALVFALASKVTNRAGAAVAALILMMSPTYMSYSSFVRVESMAMCLMLGSVLALLHALRNARSTAAWDLRWMLLSGGLAGLAAACRFHSITASLPVLLLLLFLSDRKPPAYSRKIVLAWNLILMGGFLASAGGAIGIRTGYLQTTRLGRDLLGGWSLAFEKLYPVSIAAAIVLGGACLLRWMALRKPRLDRYTHPRILALIAGCCVGCLVGTPTILWQYKFFLQSISSYSSSYFDLNRTSWPLLKNVAWFVKFYGSLIAPDKLSLLLMIVGAAIILIRRDKLVIPFLVGGLLFFVSKPINLIAAAHHFILWLPFYGIVAGYGPAVAYDAIRRRLPHGQAIAGIALVVLLAVLALIMHAGPISARANMRGTEQRMQRIATATDWIHKNTAPDAVVAVSYYCFNPDIFYTWLRSLEVPEPDFVFDGRRYLIWWGQRSALQGMKGYAVAMPQDLEAIKHRNDQISPGQGTDPYKDTGFERIQSFGLNPSEVDVFRFDFALRTLP